MLANGRDPAYRAAAGRLQPVRQRMQLLVHLCEGIRLWAQRGCGQALSQTAQALAHLGRERDGGTGLGDGSHDDRRFTAQIS